MVAEQMHFLSSF